MNMPRRIALISEHASPLARAGSVDAGGQNIYVAQVARCLGISGCDVTGACCATTRSAKGARTTSLHACGRWFT